MYWERLIAVVTTDNLMECQKATPSMGANSMSSADWTPVSGNLYVDLSGVESELLARSVSTWMRLCAGTAVAWTVTFQMASGTYCWSK